MKIEVQKSALISDCGKYRYLLERRWNRNARKVLWIMLNPSTADANKDDPTIRRCIDFTLRTQGYSGCMSVVNLFAYRATDPKELLKVEDPVGHDNHEMVRSSAMDADEVIVAWGVLLRRLEEKVFTTIDWLTTRGVRCLGKTKKGYPRHPLYLPKDSFRMRWP